MNSGTYEALLPRIGRAQFELVAEDATIMSAQSISTVDGSTVMVYTDDGNNSTAFFELTALIANLLLWLILWHGRLLGTKQMQLIQVLYLTFFGLRSKQLFFEPGELMFKFSHLFTQCNYIGS